MLQSIFVTPAQLKAISVVRGFSLVEVVIAIAIVAFIAGIAIPGIMTSASNNKRLGVIKQTMSIIGDAFNNKLEANQIDTNAGFEQFMNVGNEGVKYTRYFPGTTAATQVSFTIDPPPNPIILCNTGSLLCVGTTDGSTRAFTLKNGAYVIFNTAIRFGTAANAALPLVVDPDGEARDDFNTVGLWLYADGRIRTNRTIEPNTTYFTGSTQTVNPSGTSDPAWLVT
jgi:prepilin-type N-terminal cleavage/methylation domain-containing protein